MYRLFAGVRYRVRFRLMKIDGDCKLSPLEAVIFGKRSSRTAFWFGLVGIYFLLLFAFVPFGMLGGAIDVCANPTSKRIVAAYLCVPGILLLRLAGRRLHDIGWSGWIALALPAFVFIEGDVVKGNVRYYCDVSALSPIQDLLSPA